MMVPVRKKPFLQVSNQSAWRKKEWSPLKAVLAASSGVQSFSWSGCYDREKTLPRLEMGNAIGVFPPGLPLSEQVLVFIPPTASIS